MKWGISFVDGQYRGLRWRYCAFGAIVAVSAPAHAQVTDSLLPPPVSPSVFEVDENQVLRQQEQSDWSALGVRLSSFIVRPRLDFTNGVTTNAYQNSFNKRSSVFTSVGPNLNIDSDWSRHSVSLAASADFDRYVSEPRRNEDRWSLLARSRLEVSRDLNFQFRVEATQSTLSRFSGDVTNDATSVATYRSDLAQAVANVTLGRIRVSARLEHYNVRFKPLRLIDGNDLDQSFLDRKILQGSVQFEYGLSPSVALFANATFNRFDFDQPGASYQNSDSSGKRVLSGIRLQVPGLANLAIGVGYSRRRYEAAGLREIGRFSAEGRLKVFPSELTTITFLAGRRLSDAQLIDANPFNLTFYSLRVDHAPRRALGLYVAASSNAQSYLASDLKARTRQGQIGGRYLVTRNLELGTETSYSKRNPDLRNAQRAFDEFRSTITATVKF